MKMRRKWSLENAAFDFIVYGAVAAVGLLTLFPFLYIFFVSISDTGSVLAGEVLIWPKGLNFQAYETVFQYRGIWQAYFNTLFYTAVGTAMSLFLTVCAAYPMSRKDWKLQKLATWMIALTMWFGGGMIPFYLVFRDLGLINTRFSILIYAALSAFLIILMRTYFQSLPKELEEAAKMDGAGDPRLLLQIVLPLSKPVLAVVGLYYAVGKWNSYFWEMILLHKDSLLPLQVMLVRIIKNNSFGTEIERAITQGKDIIPLTIQYATIIVAVVPIILVYPFLQRHFMKGVMIGAIKS